ncbi:tRNA-modifying protein YgfZ [Ferrimonas pelagia]|uniref:tRNA-modifying protein YgfZ n=1 Tax=Ferrimonas pelagia TaxID=1177826 RepID=A0ABP9EFJ8_9GAMM
MTTPTLIPLNALGVLRAHGDDRQSYLQGQLTCDLVKLDPTQWHFGGHCDPKGKLIAAFRWLHSNDEILMLMPSSLIPLEQAALGKYAVFNKVEFVDASADYQCFALLNGQALLADWSGSGNLRQQGRISALLDGERALLLLPQGVELPESLAQLAQSEQAAFIASELEAGRPWFEAEHTGEFVPQMVNLDAIGGVQYDKGCYIGQETVARMHFRGGNKRALYVLQGAATDGDTLEMQLGDNWRRAGTIVAKQLVGEQIWLTAIMNKALEPDTAFRLGDTPLTLAPLPYALFSTETK